MAKFESGWRRFGVYGRQWFKNDWGPEFRVNTDAANNQQNPKVTVLPDGLRFVVVWEHATDGDGVGVRYKISEVFSPTPSTPFPYVLPGPDKKANQLTAGNQLRPAVSILPAINQFVVVWKSNNNLVTRTFDLNGRINSDFIVAPLTGTLLGSPAVSPWSTGWIVTWQDVGGVFVKTFHPNSNQQKLSMATVGNQPATPSIAGLPSRSKATIVWESSAVDQSGYGIASRTFGC